MKKSVLLFALVGSALATHAAALWDQSAHDPDGIGTPDQELPDFSAYSTYQVNDVITDPGGWNVSTVSTYFTKGWGDWAGVSAARLNVFAKAGQLPDITDRPWEGALVPITMIDWGDRWELRASGLDIELAGDFPYWIGLTPIAAYGQFGQEFHLEAQKLMGDQAAWRDRGWSGEYGWTGISALGSGPADTAFKLEGTIIPEPGALLLRGSAVGLCRRR